jgi:protein Jumonji
MGAGGVGEDSAKGKRKRNSAYLQESISEEPKRTRVHAQRKFAQGAGGASPQVSPIKEIRTRAKNDNGSSSSSSSSGPSFPIQKGERPKTEDFLTFLCLRGTDFLPPELDFFNQASTTQNNDTSDDSSSDQDDVDKDPEVDKNGIEKKKSKRLSTNKSKKDNSTPNMKKNKDTELKQKEPKNAIRKTRSHSQDSLSSPERKTEPRQTRSQGEPNKQNNLKQNNNSRKVTENDLKTDRESRAIARQHGMVKSPSHNLESSDESSTDHESKGGRTSQIPKSDSEVDADEEASSRESSRRPNSRRSEEGKARGKDTLSRFKQREGRSTSRDSSGSKESLQTTRPIRKPKEGGKSHLSKIDKKITPTKDVLSHDLKEIEKSPVECGSDYGETVKDIAPNSAEVKEEEVSKSPKDKRDSKKVKKHKNKAKTSLKDLQNILLEEAKQKIADTPLTTTTVTQKETTINSGSSSKRPSTSPADSDTPDTDERINISQKTGYVSVKPRKSIDQLSEEGSIDSGKSPQRRNSGPYAGPNGKKIAKAGERVPTPPRKILPKADLDPQRSSASPVSGRTNHLPAGVIGAAGISNRLTQPAAMSKASPMVTSLPNTVIPNLNTVSGSTYSQPLLIQTSMIPTAMTSSQPAVTQSKPVGTIGSISMHAPTAQPTIIVPGPPNGQQGTLRMPIQMSAVPLQVGMQNVQMGIRPVNGGTQVVTSAMGYQGMTGIPIIGPAGMQFGIPVQSGMHGMPAQVQQNTVQVRPQASQAVVTVPTFIRSGYAYGQPIFASNVAPATTSNITSIGQIGVTNASPLQQPTLIQQQNISIPSQLPQPQTITMPSGTTIQYNVPPTSIKQNNLQSKPPPVPSTPPTLATSTYVISTNTSPLVSPGPPTLSPQIPGSQRNVTTTSSARQVTKPDVPPVLTPPVRKQEEPKARRELSLIQQSSPSAPAPTPRTHANEPPHVPQPLYSPQAVYSGQPGAGYAPQVSPSTYPQHYQHPSPGYHQQQSPGSYHSPQGSITHSPGAYQMGSPVHNPQLSSPIHNPYQHSPYSQGYPVSPVQYNYQTSQQTHAQHTNLQPAHSQPIYTQSSHTQSQPTNSQPIHTQPAHPQPIHPQPAHAQPFQLQTGHQQPIHQQPAHQQPVHQQPVQQTAHQQPTHSHSTNQQQPNKKTIHQSNSQQQPIHSQPIPNKPDNSQASQKPPAISLPPLTPPTESQTATSQATPPPLHSPLTHSSSQYHSNRKSQIKQQVSNQVTEESHPVQLPKERAKIPVTDSIPINSTSFQKVKKDDAPKDPGQTESQASTAQPTSVNSSPLNQRKKNGDKMIKSKLGLSKNRPIKTFDVEDESSPYAFDFENPETTPKIPFRKSSSPLKPPSMIKKSTPKDTSSSQPNVSQTTHADLKPTGSHSKLNKPQESQKSPSVAKSPKVTAKLDKHKDSISVECDMETSVEESKTAETPEDASSSDNETTYFIPLKNSSGQSFGVAVKLGTDGPCGPNQKVIMTAKLVTNPSSKPTKAKILGAKTTESKTSLPVKRPDSPLQSTSTPIKEALTPRKMRMPNASPVSSRRNLISPSSDEDLTHSQLSSPAKPRMRRALSPDSGRSSGSQMKDSSSNSGKKRPMCLLGQVNTGHRFPRLGQHAQMMEAPTFRPSEAEFKDPLRYIQKIRSYAEQFGMCRIIPPKSFKPECNVDDDMRFTAYNQYINRMLGRWGPNAKETAAIKKYLETQNVDTRAHPLVGGLEVDLPALYHAVQSFGGLTEVIQKKKWSKIAEYLRVARGSNITAAGNKLDDIYVKWLLPYDTLSSVEREELLRLVEEEWAEQSREKAERSKVKFGSISDDEGSEEEEEEDEDQEAVVKGKSTSLTAFYRLARNLMSTIFRNEEPPHHTVEDEYWKIVADKDVHMQVCQGSIDTGLEGYGFPIRNSSFASHPWNLKVLTNNPRSILRAMGKVMGVTQPTLHVGMLFTTGCWYRDPHGLPWIEYLHTGSPKIWYGIPDDHSLAFYTAMKQLVPTFCKNRKIWLPSDTTMVSPSLLVKHGVSVSRAVQQPGQFVVVFPKSYTSSLCTGYCVSESVYYAPVDWLVDVDSVFMDIKDSQEPMMFPLEKMLFSLAADSRATKFVLETIKPKIEKIRDRESELRKQVISLGIKVSERLSLENDSSKEEEDDEYECHVCNANLFVSLIANVDEENTYCLAHGIEYITENKNLAKSCKMLYTHTLEELREILKKLEERLNNAIHIDEPDEDIPLREDDVVDVEEEDYVDEDDIKQRERAIPSYIKKEKKPLISSESEDNDEEEEEVHDEGPQIGAGDFLEDFPDDVDLPVIEALFGEDDEIVRPSSKRKAPRVRKFTESSEENSGDESEDEEAILQRKVELEKKKKEEAKAKASAKAKETEMKKKRS